MKKTKDDLIREEIEQSERHPNAPAGTDWTQRGRARSTVYSVRLNPEEVARIEAVAKRLDVPASTLVRGWVLNALAEQEPNTLAGTIDRLEADVRRLRELARL
jgi:predicted DNA-binding protein